MKVVPGLKDYVRSYKTTIGQRRKLSPSQRSGVRSGFAAGPFETKRRTSAYHMKLQTPRTIMRNDFVEYRARPRVASSGTRYYTKAQLAKLAQMAKLARGGGSSRSDAVRKAWITRKKKSGGSR